MPVGPAGRITDSPVVRPDRVAATRIGGVHVGAFERVSRVSQALAVVDADTVWMVGYATPPDDSGETKLVTRDGGLT